MEIKVKIERQYGHNRVFPVCAKAKLFAAISGQKTFTEKNLSNIKELGYKVSVVSSQPDVL